MDRDRKTFRSTEITQPTVLQQKAIKNPKAGRSCFPRTAIAFFEYPVVFERYGYFNIQVAVGNQPTEKRKVFEFGRSSLAV